MYSLHMIHDPRAKTIIDNPLYTTQTMVCFGKIFSGETILAFVVYFSLSWYHFNLGWDASCEIHTYSLAVKYLKSDFKLKITFSGSLTSLNLSKLTFVELDTDFYIFHHIK